LARSCSAGDIQRVTREIQILKHVRHPNVVRLLEVIEKPRHIYLVTEFLAGGELFDFIVAHNRLHESQACHIFRQVRRPAGVAAGGSASMPWRQAVRMEHGGRRGLRPRQRRRPRAYILFLSPLADRTLACHIPTP
jgi:hypothetical protein